VNDNQGMVKRPRNDDEALRVARIEKLVRDGTYPLEPRRLAACLLSDPQARERLEIEPLTRRTNYRPS